MSEDSDGKIKVPEGRDLRPLSRGAQGPGGEQEYFYINLIFLLVLFPQTLYDQYHHRPRRNIYSCSGFVFGIRPPGFPRRPINPAVTFLLSITNAERLICRPPARSGANSSESERRGGGAARCVFTPSSVGIKPPGVKNAGVLQQKSGNTSARQQWLLQDPVREKPSVPATAMETTGTQSANAPHSTLTLRTAC